MYADFVKGQIVHLDSVDPVPYMLLHPLSHFAISDVRQIFDGTPELGGVGEVVRRMVEQQRSNLGRLRKLTLVGGDVLVRRFGEVAVRRTLSRRREGTRNKATLTHL